MFYFHHQVDKTNLMRRKQQVQRNLCWNVSLSVCGWQKKTAESWHNRFGTDENKSRTTKGPINVHVATIFITDIKIGFKRLYYWLPAFNRKQSEQKRKCRRRKKNNSKTHKKQFFFHTEKENYTPDINPRWCIIDYWDLSWK